MNKTCIVKIINEDYWFLYFKGFRNSFWIWKSFGKFKDFRIRQVHFLNKSDGPSKLNQWIVLNLIIILVYKKSINI